MLKSQVSLQTRERTWICFVLQVAMGSESSKIRKEKSIQDSRIIQMENQQNEGEAQPSNDSYNSL
jgi:hypothetical protein